MLGLQLLRIRGLFGAVFVTLSAAGPSTVVWSPPPPVAAGSTLGTLADLNLLLLLNRELTGRSPESWKMPSNKDVICPDDTETCPAVTRLSQLAGGAAEGAVS